MIHLRRYLALQIRLNVSIMLPFNTLIYQIIFATILKLAVGYSVYLNWGQSITDWRMVDFGKGYVLSLPLFAPRAPADKIWSCRFLGQVVAQPEEGVEMVSRIGTGFCKIAHNRRKLPFSAAGIVAVRMPNIILQRDIPFRLRLACGPS